MNILKLLASKSFIIYSKPLAKLIGLHEAILWGQLCSLYDLFDQEEFFFEQERMIEDTQLSLHLLRKATKHLQELNLISIKKKGIPAKYYYTLHESAFLGLISSGIKSDSTSDTKFNSTGDIKSDSTISNNKEVIINNENKELHPLQKYITENLPTVSKLKTQLTDIQCEKLLKEYPKELINETLEAMENFKLLTKRYNSVYLTLKNWIKLRQEKNGNGSQKKKEYELNV